MIIAMRAFVIIATQIEKEKNKSGRNETKSNLITTTTNTNNNLATSIPNSINLSKTALNLEMQSLSQISPFFPGLEPYLTTFNSLLSTILQSLDSTYGNFLSINQTKPLLGNFHMKFHYID